MDLLLGQDTAGKVLLGDEELLRERVNQGDDITLFVESRTYSEYLTFSNFLVLPSGVVGLSLQHTQPARNVRRPMSVFMLYDSTNKVVFCRQELNNGVFRSSGTDKPNAYQTYTWYSTRAYNASDESLDSLLLLGNTLKVRVILNEDTCLIIKPEIIYFPYKNLGPFDVDPDFEGKDWLVASSEMVLPQVIAENPNLWNPDLGLTNCESFSLAYLTIDSNGELWVRSQGCFDISKGMSIVSAWWNKLWRLFSKICREFGGIVLVKSYPPKLFIENYEYQILSPKPVINEEMR